MKKFKIITIFFLTLSLLMCVSAVGCSGDDKIDDLQQRITALEKENENLSERLKDLEDENSNLSDRLLNLESRTVKGVLYSLQTAYDANLLTTEDLQRIADYHNNKQTCTEQIPYLNELVIKRAAASYALNEQNISKAKAEDFEILKNYGKYNDSFAIILNHPYHGHADVAVDKWETVGGVSIHYTNFDEIAICHMEKEI